MAFLTPIWLWLLVPWAMLAAWVFFGRAAFARVSSTQFWEKDQTLATPRRGVRIPPWPIVALLTAVLFLVLAGGGLRVRAPFRDAPLVLIIDHGLLTAAAMRNDDGLVSRLYHGRHGPVQVVGVPGDEIITTDQSGTFPLLRDPFPSAIATMNLLPQVIRRELLRTEYPIAVITSQPVASPDPRVQIVVPRSVIRNAGIESFAVTEGPTPQAMVRLANDTDHDTATLQVGSVRQQIDLPKTGTSGDYFIDLPSLGEWVSAELVVEDDIAADNVAYLVRVNGWPRVEARGALPPAVERIIEIYSHQRPAAASAKVISITADPTATADLMISAAHQPTRGAVHVEADHPVTRGVDWNTLLANTTTGPVPSAARGGRVLVAVGSTPVLIEFAGPKLWLGLDLAGFSKRADFVVFFTNAIDYLGRGDQVYSSQAPRAMGTDWRQVQPAGPLAVHASPGIYQSESSLLAQSAPAIRVPSHGPEAVQARSAVVSGAVPAWISMVPALLLASILLTLTAALRLTRK